MEFLKELFGEKPLTFDEFTDKVNQKGLKLFDLSAGGYMSMEKHRGIVEGLKEQLNTANEKLTDYDPELKNTGVIINSNGINIADGKISVTAFRFVFPFPCGKYSKFPNCVLVAVRCDR